jgi:glycosyltransferase involved in cell wall biosynthesis
VAINGRAAVRLQIGGVERLAREMAVGLPRLRPERYRLIEPRPELAHRAGHLWEQAALPALAAGCQLIYSPANLAPLAARRNVIVIHDLAAWRHPDAYSRTYVIYQRQLLPLLARRARRLITVSEFSKRELIEVLGVLPERVDVIPLGVDGRFSPRADPGPAIQRYGLERPYVLVVGTPSARKNLASLQPIQRALTEHGAELVLAGSDRGYLRAGEAPGRRLGYVEESELPGLYAAARAVVMPSRYEGFGLPCLEAMASGTPVVAARRGALPETCHESALLADPDDERGFTQAVLAATLDGDTRRRLMRAGPIRAASYTWQRTIELTDASITAALRGGRRDAGR